MPMPIKLAKNVRRLGLVMSVVVGVGTTAVVVSGIAFAQQSVSLSPAGPYANGQSVTVSGSGFTGIPPSGLQIIECADPGGTTANLPTDASTGCDGTTVSGNQITPDPTTGDFTTTYQVSTLSVSSGSTINCDTSDDCVLWVGEDYNTMFLNGPHAFSPAFLFSAAKTPQTISFTSTAPSNATVGGPTYTVSATASSGLTVGFTVDSSATSVCSIPPSGSVVSFIGTGTCTIDANQPGNATYAAATQVQQSFNVSSGTQTSQTISFTSTAPSSATVGGPTYAASATATSGLPVSFTIDSTATSVCAVSESVVSFIGTGTCTIDANQPGNTTYAPAPQVQQSFNVGPQSATTTFTTSQVSSTSVVLGSSATDTATVHGTTTNGSPTGTVAFYVCQTGTTQTLSPGPCAATAPDHLSTAHLVTGASDTSTAASGSFTPTSAGTWCFSAVYTSNSSYSGSSDNTTASNPDNNECFVLTTATSTTTSFISSAHVTLGPSGSVNDSVTVTGGLAGGSPTGTVVFYLCHTGTTQTMTPAPCAPGGTPEDPGESLLTGQGDSSSATSASVMPASTGTWCFSAVYQGSAQYQGSSDNTSSSNLDSNECVLVSSAPSTTASFVSVAHVTLGPGGTVTDSVTVTGNSVGGSPTGTVDFYVCGPGSAVALCTSTAHPEGAPTLAASGSDTSVATSSTLAPGAAGTWCFAAVYVPSAGANYAGSSDNQSGSPDTNECFNATIPPDAITSPNHPPAPAVLGQTFTFTVTTSGAYQVPNSGIAPPKIRKKGKLPRGLHLVDSHTGTATITGIPKGKKTGTYTPTIIATFGKGKTKVVVTQVFTLTVT
jgi:hypothetical protein